MWYSVACSPVTRLRRPLRAGVAPGPIWTPLISATFPEQKVAKFGEETPLGRAGHPSEVAPAYVFLASADASYITGQVIHPNGEQTRAPHRGGPNCREENRIRTMYREWDLMPRQNRVAGCCSVYLYWWRVGCVRLFIFFRISDSLFTASKHHRFYLVFFWISIMVVTRGLIRGVLDG